MFNYEFVTDMATNDLYVLNGRLLEQVQQLRRTVQDQEKQLLELREWRATNAANVRAFMRHETKELVEQLESAEARAMLLGEQLEAAHKQARKCRHCNSKKAGSLTEQSLARNCKVQTEPLKQSTCGAQTDLVEVQTQPVNTSDCGSQADSVNVQNQVVDTSTCGVQTDYKLTAYWGTNQVRGLWQWCDVSIEPDK